MYYKLFDKSVATAVGGENLTQYNKLREMDCVHIVNEGEDNEALFVPLYLCGEYESVVVSREDFEEIGFDTSNITDNEMARIASKIGDSLVEGDYWELIREWAYNYKMPMKNGCMNDYDKIGNIVLGGNVVVSDPCYDTIDANYNILFTTVINGEYDCYTLKKKCENWGNRVWEMLLVHKDYNVASHLDFEFCGVVYVDSGTMSISNEDYFNKTRNNDDWYEKNVMSWCGETREHLIKDNMFMSETGFGDGCYDVYCLYDSDNNIYAIKVVFIEND